MIIDLLGAPGSGKTYISENVKKELNNNNIFIFDFIEFEKNNLFGKIFHKVLFITVKFIPSYRRIFFELRKILGTKYNCTAQYNKTRVIEFYLWRIVYLLFVNDLIKIMGINCIINEGVSHVLVAMNLDFELDPQNLKNITRYLFSYSNSVTYFVSMPLEKIKENILKRNRHEAAIDELTGEKLEIFLAKFNKSCNAIIDYNNNSENKFFYIDNIKKGILEIVCGVENRKGS